MFNNFQKAVLVLGVVGIGAVAASPSFAIPASAYASGSSTITLMNGASNSVGGEVAAAAGNNLGSTVTVNPAVAGVLNTNTALITGLSVTASAPSASVAALTFTAAAANRLAAAPDLQAQVSIIRAGAGADGLD